MILTLVVLSFMSTVTCTPFPLKCDTNGTIYYCPLRSDPPHLDRCCGDSNMPIKCCESEAPHDDDKLLMIVSITVILSCFIISVLMIVCCFWSRCPLFDLCWVNYSRKGVIAYTMEVVSVLTRTYFWFSSPFHYLWLHIYVFKGPLYTAKEGEALNEPPDENEYAHQYSPVNVKMNRVDDV